MKLGKTEFIELLIFLFIVNTGKAQLSFTESGQNLGNVGYANATGDLNNDGYPDIYIVNCDKSDEIWFNQGKGVFINNNQKIGNAMKYTKNTGLADLDGDGDLDIFIANDADWRNKNPTVGLPNEVWINQGKGKFTDSGQRLGNLASVDVALGDVDGDGDVDAVVANLHNTDLGNLTYQSNEVWLNDGKGNFRISGQSLGIGSLHVKLADIDADKDLDAVFQHPEGGGFVLWINDGKGKFTESTNIIGSGSNLTFGDIDSDGDQDAFIVKGGPNGSAPCEVWLNNGKGKFTDSQQRLGNLVGYDVALGDMDGDGDLDALVTNGTRTAQAPVLWINQGGMEGGKAGTFKESGVVFPNSQIGKVKLVDLDKDGDLDIVITNYAGANKIYLNNHSGSNYLNLTTPGKTPVLFAPTTISIVGNNEHTLSVSSDGNEIYFTRDPIRRTFVVRRQGNTWSNPIQAAFTGREAIFSSDGSNLYYNDGDIWYIAKKGNDWSSPKKLGSAINTAAHEYYASVSNDGTLYFSRIDADYAHIYGSELENGQYLQAKRLPSPINLDSCNNYHSFISPKGDYIIFNSNRAGGFGGADLYICFKKANGNWGDAINLGNEINSDSFDLCPVVSPDGKYFFFTKYNSSNKEGDIYWVSAAIIDCLRK